MPDNDISIILPAYKAEAFIERSARSALEQTVSASEVVVVSDDGVDYVRFLAGRGLTDRRLRGVATNGIGTGPANARNAGLAAASGRVIATLDADDVIEPAYLEVLAPLAHRHGAAYSARRYIDLTTNQVLESLDRVMPDGPVGLEDILTSQIHSWAGIVFDRQRVHAQWPSWTELWEDVYFFVRCFDDVDFLYHVSNPLYHYFRNPSSICNDPAAGHRHLDSALALLARLERGETLDLRNPATREIYCRYLTSRARIESEFIQAQDAGTVTDFHAFIRRHREHFYTLDVAAAENGI